ncbi:MAG: ABC transporter permease [Treponema sp.]|nr:ABC transporter permease [Treponema sp.]
MVKEFGQHIRLKISNFLYSLGYLGRLIVASLMFTSRGRTARKILIMQLLFTYVEALPICAILAIVIGTSVVFMGTTFLASLGQAKLTYDLLVIIVTKELGPLLVAFIVTARSATAIATELSTMVVNQEIEAYISVGIDPIIHLAAPRFLGVTFSVFFLNLYFSIFGLIVPSLAIQFISTTSIAEYFKNLFTALSFKAITISNIKSIVFGMIISGCATLYGFNTGRAFTEIPMAGLKAVSKSFVYLIIAYVFITVITYIF